MRLPRRRVIQCESSRPLSHPMTDGSKDTGEFLPARFESVALAVARDR